MVTRSTATRNFKRKFIKVKEGFSTEQVASLVFSCKFFFFFFAFDFDGLFILLPRVQQCYFIFVLASLVLLQ